MSPAKRKPPARAKAPPRPRARKPATTNSHKPIGEFLNLFEIGERDRGGWQKRKLAFLETVEETISALGNYWPLTLRQVFYRLVAKLLLANDIHEYRNLSRLLVKARLGGLIAWEAMEDRSRTFLASAGWRTPKAFFADEARNFLTGYRRDLAQSQEIGLEVWLEKDALAHIAHNVTFPYCVPVMPARGFTSVSWVHECRLRILGNAEEGKKTRILYFGDLDPSGWEMLPAMLRTLSGEMDLLEHIEAVRVALLPEQVDEYELPHDPEALKEKDPRRPRYEAMLRERGYPEDLAVELDAFSPEVLEGLVRQAIKGSWDLNLFEKEGRRENKDLKKIAEMRGRALSALGLDGDEEMH